jgi:hypothetical protein
MPDRARILVKSAVAALVLWLGEAVVGLLPWLTYALVSDHIASQNIAAVCDRSMSNCTPIAETPYAEICILIVVISGLAFLALLNFGPHRRTAPFTALTYVLGLLTLLTLIIGAVFYGLVTARVDSNAGSVIRGALYVALVVSAGLSVERTILET